MKPAPVERVYRVVPSGRALHLQTPQFVSVTIDTSVLIGGRWWGATKGTQEGLGRDRVAPLDLSHPDLGFWARQLAPAMVRFGGTEADRILYGFTGDSAAASGDQPFVLKGKRWREINEWVAEQGFTALFTVSAGPEARDASGAWNPEGAERLIRKTIQKGYPVVAWEFGNEVNAYPFLYGLPRAVSPRRYLADFAVFANLVRKWAPGTRTVGPSSAIWPLIGEPYPLLPSLGRSPVSAFLDVLSFHYYPQQSDRGRVAVRRAGETNLLNARALNGALRWLRYARRSLARGAAAQAPVWLTEFGHALYGGQAGVSDTWLSTPWWVDQLGLLSQAGVGAVFRQSLVGGDYGLLDSQSMAPRPDYWATLVWKQKMGPVVHHQPTVKGPDRRLRAWHHSWPDGRSCLALINLSRSRAARVEVDASLSSYDVLGPADDRDSRVASWNERRLVGSRGLADLRQTNLHVPDTLILPPLSCAFVGLREQSNGPWYRH